MYVSTSGQNWDDVFFFIGTKFRFWKHFTAQHWDIFLSSKNGTLFQLKRMYKNNEKNNNRDNINLS